MTLVSPPSASYVKSVSAPPASTCVFVLFTKAGAHVKRPHLLQQGNRRGNDTVLHAVRRVDSRGDARGGVPRSLQLSALLHRLNQNLAGAGPRHLELGRAPHSRLIVRVHSTSWRRRERCARAQFRSVRTSGRFRATPHQAAAACPHRERGGNPRPISGLTRRGSLSDARP